MTKYSVSMFGFNLDENMKKGTNVGCHLTMTNEEAETKIKRMKSCVHGGQVNVISVDNPYSSYDYDKNEEIINTDELRIFATDEQLKALWAKIGTHLQSVKKEESKIS